MLLGLFLFAFRGLTERFALVRCGVLFALLLMAKSHLLKILLLLEAMSLTIVISASLAAVSLFPFIYFLFIILTFIVCEAALGLGLLITVSRNSGGELISISLFKLNKLQTFKV